jgi:hypothetical protein
MLNGFSYGKIHPRPPLSHCLLMVTRDGPVARGMEKAGITRPP